MIRLIVLFVVSLVLQVGPVSRSNICYPPAVPPARGPNFYHCSVTCYSNHGPQSFFFRVPGPTVIDGAEFCASKGMYISSRPSGNRRNH